MSESAVITFVYAVLPLITIIVGLGLIWWIYRTAWDRQGSRAFAGLLCFQVLWMVLLIAHVLLSEPAIQRIVLIFESTAAHTSIAMFVVFVSAYTGANFLRRTPIFLAVIAYPLGFLALAVTNPAHGMLYESMNVYSDPFHYVGPEMGPAYGVVMLLMAVLVGYSAFVIHRYLHRTQLHSDLQIVLLLLAIMPIGVIELLGQIGVFPAVHMHHAAYGSLPFNVLATIALFWLGLFDVQPIARTRVFENLRDPVLLLDDTGSVVDHNAAARKHFSELPEQTGVPLEVLAPRIAGSIELPAGDEETKQRVALPTNGTRRHYSVTVSPIDEDDGQIGWYAVVLRDVTAIERSRERLETQNDRLEQVASTISHDLRNPIQIATGHADLLDEQLEDIADEESEAEQPRTHIEQIDGSLERMQAIIDDVLELARQGSEVRETTPVSLDRVAREAWSNVDTREATLSVTGDREFAADRNRLLTILENLYRNGIDHVGPDVHIEVGATEGGFYVQDDGPGIPPEEADDVFDFGYTTAREGTGLGLSIVQTMAESHGWAVSLAEDANGARFEFDLEAGPTPNMPDGDVSVAESE